MPSGNITTSAPPSPSMASSAMTCASADPRAAIACCSIGSECISAARSSIRSLLAHDLHAEHDARHDRRRARAARRRPAPPPRTGGVGAALPAGTQPQRRGRHRRPTARRAHLRCPPTTVDGACTSRGGRNDTASRNDSTSARALVVAFDVARDLLAFLAVERVEREQRQELVELGAGQLSVHDDVIPDSTSVSRRRRNPTRIRLLTVPSGWSSSSATSR